MKMMLGKDFLTNIHLHCHYCQLKEAELYQQQGREVLLKDQHTCCNFCLLSDEEQITSHKLDQVAEVFVKGKKTLSLTVQFPLSEASFCKLVAETVNIPRELMHFTLGGRCISEELPLVPGVTLHYTIKGKGGMHSGVLDSKETDICSVQKESSEEEVKTWLLVTCGLTSAEIMEFDFVNGITLFSYRDIHTLSKQTKITIEKARKIIYLRDHPGEKSAMLMWSSEDLVRHMKQWLNRDSPDLDRFMEKLVDGVVFMTYRDAMQMEEELCLKPVLAQRILAERDRFLEKEKTKTTVQTTNSVAFESESQEMIAASLSSVQESSVLPLVGATAEVADKLENVALIPHSAFETSEGISVGQQVSNEGFENVAFLPEIQEHITLDKGTGATRYKMFLQEELHLYPLSPNKMTLLAQQPIFHECDLRIIYHKRKDLNELEQCFLFVLLCNPNFCSGKLSKAAVSKLWELITGDVPTCWIKQLPRDVQERFTVTKERIYYHEKEVTFDKESAKTITLSEYERTVKKCLDDFCIKLLLVDRQLLHDNSQGYRLQIGCRKDSDWYHFGFQTDTCYWLFDSEEFDSHFQHEFIPKSKAGLLHKCKFLLQMKKRDLHLNVKDHCQESTGNTEDNFADVNLNEFRKTNNLVCVLSSPAQAITSAPKEPLAIEETNLLSQDSEDYKYVHSPYGDIPLNMPWPERKKHVNPRPFKGTVCQYDIGILNVIESGDGMMITSVEFKYHGFPPALDKAKRAFLKKSLEFVCGCLNARQNGTIYFGVAEKSGNDKQHEYGEITGVELTQSLRSQYYDLFREYLAKCFPKHEETVKLCVMGPSFIKIKKSNPEKYVIEIDIEPSSKVCKDELFMFDYGSIMDKFGEVTKKDQQRDGTGIYRRDGSQTKYLGPTEKKEFEREILKELVKKRVIEEKRWELSQQRIITSEAHKLRNFIADCDDSVYPILIISNQTQNVREISMDYFKFVQHIRWAAVFDFDKDSEINGIYSYYKSAVISNCVTEAIVTDFCDMSVCDRRDKLCFPKKTTWLFANGKSNGFNQFEQLGLREWKKKYLTFIQNAVSFYRDNSVIPPARRLVLTLVSEEMGEGILETAEYIATAFGWDKMFFIFDSEYTRSYFIQDFMFSDDVLKHSAVLPWRDVHFTISKTLHFEKRDKSKDVCTASGAVVPIPSNEWQAWTDLDILSANECQELADMSDAHLKSLIETEEMQFYNGRQVSWKNFYFKDQVMERASLAEIKVLVESMALNVDDIEYSIPKVTLGHMPGTGGTTLGRHVLWVLRKRFKCAIITRITKETEHQVCQFWEAEEYVDNKQQLKPVILLVDNVASNGSVPDEHELSRKLYVRQKQFQLSKPLAILIYCHRSVIPKANFCLTQQIHDQDERIWMERKHKELEKKTYYFDSGVQTFLGFLSMRYEFDKQYLQSTMIPYLTHADLEKNERELIKYIALIMTYFPPSQGSPEIPVICCDKVMQTIRHESGRELQWEKKLSKVAKVILVVEHSNDIGRPIVRIASTPYAQATLKAIMSHDNLTLADIAIQCLESCLVTEHSYTNLNNIMKKILIEREYRETEDNKTHMSPLVMDIKVQVSFQKAVEVLDLGFKQLKDEVFFQQLARLYLKENLFDDAEKCAKKAVELSPLNGEFKHTLGLVYLKLFEGLERKNSKNSNVVEEHCEELRVAFRSLNIFIEAQSIEVQTCGDALAISYAHCDAIRVINLILKYVTEKVLSPVDITRFGRYLTEETFPMKEFDTCLGFRENIKSLLSEGMKALEFLYYLGYSYKSRQERKSFKSCGIEFAILYVKDMSVRHFKMFAKVMKTIIPPFASTCNYSVDRLSIRLKLENIKLLGSFFESILYQVLLYNYPDFNPHKTEKRKLKSLAVKKPLSKKRMKDMHSKCVDILQKIKFNLDQISSLSDSDMDNYISVCLALELVGIQTDFTLNSSKIYKMCNKIILSKSDPVRTMRAHLFRVLVSWPRKTNRVFIVEEFRMSFQCRTEFLLCRGEPLTPSVHFFIAKSSAKFHLCHWSQIFNPDDETEYHKAPLVMHQRLQPFVGFLKAEEKNGELKNYILMELSAYAEELFENLKIRAVRGKKIFVNTKVQFYLGFSLQGPVAYVFEEVKES